MARRSEKLEKHGCIDGHMWAAVKRGIAKLSQRMYALDDFTLTPDDLMRLCVPPHLHGPVRELLKLGLRRDESAELRVRTRNNGVWKVSVVGGTGLLPLDGPHYWGQKATYDDAVLDKVFAHVEHYVETAGKWDLVYGVADWLAFKMPNIRAVMFFWPAIETLAREGGYEKPIDNRQPSNTPLVSLAVREAMRETLGTITTGLILPPVARTDQPTTTSVWFIESGVSRRNPQPWNPRFELEAHPT
jgi:hypothetical protein